MAMPQMDKSPVVEITNLTKRYGERVAVDGLDLSVRRGEIFGIIGANGAGKTTSVECAQGLRRPDSGSVRVLGLDPISQRQQLRGRVGSQLQDSSLPDRLRVGEALRLFAQDDDQIDAAMSDWHLHDLASSAFGDLSGGQRQRLFLALALLNDPEIVFLDELTQGLDPGARRSVWGFVQQVRDGGATVVLVTHFMEEAEVLCDRVAVVVDGRVVDSGSPGELVERHSAGVRARFEFKPGESFDVDWLGGLPGVTAVRRTGDDVELEGESAMIAHVGHALLERGLVPSAVRVEQPDLEQALLPLLEPGRRVGIGAEAEQR